MSEEFFKEVCRYVTHNVLQCVPDGGLLSVYRKKYPDGEYYSIECGGFAYTHYSDGSEKIARPEGLNV